MIDSSAPDAIRQLVNLINSGMMTFLDQLWLWKTKGLFVKNAKITDNNQAIQLHTVADKDVKL
jgi:hypothetical protein